jgi:hypothetical protein
MNKPYQRDEVEQKQDYEGEKQRLKQSEADERQGAPTPESRPGGDDQE